MPPLFTSTNINTLLRKVVVAAKQHFQPVSRSIPGRLSRLQQAKVALRQTLHQTFPSLSASYGVQPALQPVRISNRHFSTYSGNTRFSTSPLGRAAHSVRMSGYRLSGFAPRGPAMVANVGLGSARSYATAGPLIPFNPKIPMVFRAFASQLDKEEKSGRRMPRPARVRTYDSICRQRHAQRRRLAALSASFSSIDSVDSYLIHEFHELERYFPFHPRAQPDAATLPPRPEDLVTPGSTAILTLPLAPSLQALLDSTADVSYKDTEIGVSILAGLTRGILPMHAAFSTYSSTRIIPLLAKLESLGVLGTGELTATPTELEVIYLGSTPEMLKIVFCGRSVSDVKQLLGESLKEKRGQPWFHLADVRARVPEPVAALTAEESHSIMEEWEPALGATTLSSRRPGSLPPSASDVDDIETLVFPTIDHAGIVVDSARLDEQALDASSSLGPYSFPASVDMSMLPSSASTSQFSSSPLGSTPSPMSPDLPTVSAGSALFEQHLESFFGQNEWLVSPSNEDSDIESASLDGLGSGSDWADEMGSGSDWADEMEVDRSIENEAESPGDGVWSGTGEGFGLVQPW